MTTQADDQATAGPEPAPAELLQRALAACQERRFQDAESALRRVLASSPDDIKALSTLGVVLLNLRGPGLDAERCFERVLTLDPGNAETHNNLAVMLQRQGRLQDAERHFSMAVSERPNYPAAWTNLAKVRSRQGRTQDAYEAFRRVAELRPRRISAHRNLAGVLQELGRWDEALGSLDRAIELCPDDAKGRFARGMLLLKLGRFEAGWRDYAWRFEAMKFDYEGDVDWDRPLWDGRRFEGKTLLVFHEQGLGDAIHFVRYVPLVKARGGRLLLMCGPPLFRLFETVEGVDGLLNRRRDQGGGVFPDEVDYHVPLMDLPGIFGTRLESIPSSVPYLGADPRLVAKWGERVRGQGFKVGLCWGGNPDQMNNRNRSCALADFAPLARIPGVVFYSLQKGEAAGQTARPPEGMVIEDYTEELHDLAETAALMRNLDLVITVDTSVSHLAGALGHPVWVVLSFNHCWRYLLERDDSPWYPSMRLYRQPRPGDWASVMQRVASDLADRLARSTPAGDSLLRDGPQP